MSIFKTAYDTAACAGYRVLEIEEKLKAGHIGSAFQPKVYQLENFEQSFSLELVQGGNTAADVVPFFAHPIFVRDSNDKRLVAYLDMRNFVKYNPQQMVHNIRNYPEYTWNLLRGLLNQVWIQERVELLRDVSNLPAMVYAALISESISRKYALDPAEQMTISVLACYFYYCLYTDEKVFAEHDFDKLAGKIAQLTKVPATKVFDIIDELPVINGLEMFCNIVKERTNSIRLNEFNIGVLTAIVSGNWMGTNARENLSVALEHPPTWLMIVYASITENTFKRSILAKLVERFAKGNLGVSYIRSMNALLDVENLHKEIG